MPLFLDIFPLPTCWLRVLVSGFCSNPHAKLSKLRKIYIILLFSLFVDSSTKVNRSQRFLEALVESGRLFSCAVIRRVRMCAIRVRDSVH